MAFKDQSQGNLYKNNWQKDNKDRIVILVDKGDKDKIKAAAEAEGKSLNAYINEAIQEKLNRQ